MVPNKRNCPVVKPFSVCPGDGNTTRNAYIDASRHSVCEQDSDSAHIYFYHANRFNISYANAHFFSDSDGKCFYHRCRHSVEAGYPYVDADIA